MRVKVYYNIKKHMFSVVALEGENKGRVIQSTDTVCLENCRFFVSPTGNAKVRAERRKNVHAYVYGELCGHITAIDGENVTYNPYKYTSFVKKENEQIVDRADFARLSGRSIVAWNIR